MKLSRRPGDKISREMFGLFFEDINFAADGGLYAELIENRSFEARRACGIAGKFYTEDDFGWAWSPVYRQGEQPPVMRYVSGTPLSAANPHYLRFTAAAPEQGFANSAYDGVCLREGGTYKISFYARCVEYEGAHFTVSVEKDGAVYGTARLEAVKPVPYLPFSDVGLDMRVDHEPLASKLAELKRLDTSRMCREHAWNQYEATLTVSGPVTGARFVLRLDGPGVVEFDLISMIPGDAVAGVFRRDLFEALKALNPGFIRFPGGCIVEGISLANRYQWKRTVGELKDRTYIPNLWAFDDDRGQTNLNNARTDAHYGQSYGLGFYEYFLLCELLGAKPLPVLNIGAACQFRTTELVPSDSPEFEAYIQDALDLIEFANGPADSGWGKLRADMGHPRPFGLGMLGVGNEQWETKHVDLFERHRRFARAIHQRYPEIRLIGTAGPVVDMPLADLAWRFYRDGNRETPGFCYAVDEHYYVSPEWMYGHTGFYDSYDRDVAVFAGEYAAHTADKANSMESALAEAAFMTGLERNAGVVKLASYAPLFNRIGHSQWKPDLIWFDDRDVYLTPNYHVQALYANHLGDRTVPLDGQEAALRKEGVYLSVSATAEGELILKAVNTNGSPYELPLNEEDGSPMAASARLWVLEAAGEAPADMPQPSRVRQDAARIDGSLTLAPQSFTVARFSAEDHGQTS